MKKSGLFDCMIAVLCLIYPVHIYSGSWLRLLRVSATSILLIDQLDHFDILLSGIANGLQSIKFTVAMMLFFALFYGFISATLFGANDPFHFSGVGTSMWTFIEVMTLEGWNRLIRP